MSTPRAIQQTHIQTRTQTHRSTQLTMQRITTLAPAAPIRNKRDSNFEQTCVSGAFQKRCDDPVVVRFSFHRRSISCTTLAKLSPSRSLFFFLRDTDRLPLDHARGRVANKKTALRASRVSEQQQRTAPKSCRWSLVGTPSKMDLRVDPRPRLLTGEVLIWENGRTAWVACQPHAAASLRLWRACSN